MHATKTNVSPLYCTGMCIDLCIQFTLMFWLPSANLEYLLYILAGMWGVTDGIFKTQISGKLENRAYIFISWKSQSRIETDTIAPTKLVLDHGVILDSELSMITHVNKISCVCL